MPVVNSLNEKLYDSALKWIEDCLWLKHSFPACDKQICDDEKKVRIGIKCQNIKLMIRAASIQMDSHKIKDKYGESFTNKLKWPNGREELFCR